MTDARNAAGRMIERTIAWVSRIGPGLAIAVGIALISRFLAQWLPPTISEVLLAVFLGMIAANVVGLPRTTAPGITFAVQRILRLGIILLGARLSLGAVLDIGLGALGLVIVCMIVALSVALLAGRVAKLPSRLALLIGVGTAVCGNSAIIATAPVIQAEEREVSFAVATITLFGTLAVFLYPLIGHALGLSDRSFGLWSGVAVNDTSQVVAASAAFSTTARDVATVVKLVRNGLMAPLIVLIAWWWERRAVVATGAVSRGIRKAVPLFVLGFLTFVVLRTADLIDAPLAARIDAVATFSILVALSGVGLGTRVAQMRSMGLSPFYVGLGTATLLAVLSLAAIVGLHLAPQT
jgi:uncharacterized integral membrane protein (TIGR00698 family)